MAFDNVKNDLFSSTSPEESNPFGTPTVRKVTNNDNDLRRQLGLKKSLQLLGQSSSPMFQAASPLIKEAGTPLPFLSRSGNRPQIQSWDEPKENRSGTSLFESPTNNSLSYPSKSPALRNSFIQKDFELEAKDANQSSFLFDKEPSLEGGDELFDEFMQLYSNHPHSADVFELIDQYEELCRRNIKTLLEYINKNDPARRRLKKSIELLNQLYQECYTWRLISSLFRDRMLDEGEGKDYNMEDLPTIDSAKSERLIVENLFEYEPSTRQCQIIVDWLERNMQDKLEDLLSTENLKFHSESIYWEHTLHDLAQIRMGSKDPSLASNLVTEVDPDAPIRQNRVLSSLDQQDEEQLLLYMFRFIRAGKLEEAQKLCCDQGHFWRAATLDGWRLWHDPNFFNDESNGDVLSAEGNPDRDIWKINCWSLSEEKSCHMYEKAMYAALSGHLKQLLPGCASWDDCLWAYFKVLVDLRVEQEIRNYPRTGEDFAELPKAYWEQVSTFDLTPRGIIDQLNAHSNMEIKKQCNDRFRILQTDIILNEVGELLSHLNSSIRTEDTHFVRFMAHVVLFLQARGLQSNEEYCVNILKKYVEVLIDTKKNDIVAAYTARLPAELQVEMYARFLEGFEDSESRAKYLELADEAGLELKQITKQIVENIRLKTFEVEGSKKTECDVKKINSIDWLIYDPSQRGEAVKQANAIIREFLAGKNHDGAREVFSKIPSDAIDNIHKQWRKKAGEKPLPSEYEDAIREYLCIKTYLQAHEAFDAWFKHYHHSAPIKPEQKAHRTFKEQISYEERMKEYEANFGRWKNTLELHCKSSSESIYNVLLFPGGWMCDQRQDTQEIDLQRHQQLASLRELCIPYITFLLHSVLQSNQQYRECMQLAEIIQSKQYKLYSVFQKQDIQRFLSLIRQSAISLLDEGYDPFGFERE